MSLGTLVGVLALMVGPFFVAYCYTDVVSKQRPQWTQPKASFAGCFTLIGFVVLGLWAAGAARDALKASLGDFLSGVAAVVLWSLIVGIGGAWSTTRPGQGQYYADKRKRIADEVGLPTEQQALCGCAEWVRREGEGERWTAIWGGHYACRLSIEGHVVSDDDILVVVIGECNRCSSRVYRQALSDYAWSARDEHRAQWWDSCRHEDVRVRT
ncbi:hypothetical protein FLW53_26895 [Microbispora sp. SCL1-1]|uniref:hypothetical protein n=1 Tax=unclassified Microbispora TaxID=2614687 RepID=UPI001173D4EF|nr:MULTISPECIES: hypothetical protein [unclassified Microbispora]TQS10546.1 hypothetical protein FLW53_26895 [Microbispora sp. SCL1-1]